MLQGIILCNPFKAKQPVLTKLCLVSKESNTGMDIEAVETAL